MHEKIIASKVDREKVKEIFNNHMLLTDLSIPQPGKDLAFASLNAKEKEAFLGLGFDFINLLMGTNKHEVITQSCLQEKRNFPEGAIRYRDFLEVLLKKDVKFDIFYTGNGMPKAIRRGIKTGWSDGQIKFYLTEKDSKRLKNAILFLNSHHTTTYKVTVKRFNIEGQNRHELVLEPKN